MKANEEIKKTGFLISPKRSICFNLYGKSIDYEKSAIVGETKGQEIRIFENKFLDNITITNESMIHNAWINIVLKENIKHEDKKEHTIDDDTWAKMVEDM